MLEKIKTQINNNTLTPAIKSSKCPMLVVTGIVYPSF